MSKTGTIWTSERIDELKRLNAQGLTMSAIASHFARGGVPVSRNAVIGKLARLNESAVSQKFEWNAARDAELRRLFDLKISTREIAARLGCSGVTAFKRLKRFGLGRSRSEAMRVHHGNRNNNPVPIRRETVEPPPPPPEPPDCEPVSLMARRPFQCAFPVRDFAGPDAPFFCGAATAGSGHPSYCAWHRTINAGLGSYSERRAEHGLEKVA